MAKRKTRRRKRRTKRTGKSIHLGNGFRLNLSKSGVSLSGGVKGARISIGNKGVKSTLSIPGTGISKTKTLVSTKDIINKVKDDKDDKKPKSSKSPNKKNSKDNNLDDIIENTEESNKVTLNKEELEAIKKREESAKRVEAIESRYNSGNAKDEAVVKALDKDIPKSFIKEGFKTGLWIALIVLGVIIMIFNFVVGIGIVVVAGVLILLEFQLPKNRAKRYFNDGIDLYKEGKYDEAIKEMEKAIKFNPDHEYMNLTMGTIKFEVLEDIEGAIKHLSIVVDKYGNKDASFMLGKCYFGLEEYVKVIELLQVIEFRKAKERERALLVARCYLLTSQSKLAIEMLLPLANEYVINKDELIDVNYWLGYAYLDEFEFEQAKEYLTLVQKQDSEYKDIQRLISNIEI